MIKKVKISEQDYLYVQDLTRIRLAISILGEIMPEFSSIIDEKDYRKIMKILYTWREKYFVDLNIDTE